MTLTKLLGWFSVTLFDYNGAKKSLDMSKIQVSLIDENFICQKNTLQKKFSFGRFDYNGA